MCVGKKRTFPISRKAILSRMMIVWGREGGRIDSNKNKSENSKMDDFFVLATIRCSPLPTTI